jgi:acetyl-CoA carboxylase biotin carboxyl carrier protein
MSDSESSDAVKAAGSDQATIHSLCQEANALVNRLAGPLRRVALQVGECRVELEWDPSAAPAGPPLAGASAWPAAAAGTAAAPAAAADGAAGRHVVLAPLLGTYYGAPEPGARAFVEVGDVVEADQPVAIIEAMKIMNRIVAGVAGTISEILMQNGEWVEFEQPLMYIEPA